MRFKFHSNRSILAFGADSKARFAFAKNGTLSLSEDFGNLQDAGNFERYERSINRIIKKEKPDILACDMHPGYNSTKLALLLSPLLSSLRKQGSFSIDSCLRRNDKVNRPRNDSLKLVQHHHAHIRSCMFDNNLTGRVIGVAFDGTGYGLDGTVWGGEFLIVSDNQYKRVAHLDYVPMPGGEMAISQPWKMAVSYLYKCYGDKFLNLKIPFTMSIDKNKVLILKKMIKKGINSPQTSSMGRLFDVAGSLVNLTNSIKLEGEAAVKLEALAKKRNGSDYYKIAIIKKDKKILIITEDLIKNIVKDLERRVDKGEIAVKFHNALAKMIYDVSKKLSRVYKIKRVVLSGGVFKNSFLLNKTKILFRNSGISLYTHNNIPTTDAGISIGQAIIMG